MTFFGGSGGDSFTGRQGNFTGAPGSVAEGGREKDERRGPRKIRCTRSPWGHTEVGPLAMRPQLNLLRWHHRLVFCPKCSGCSKAAQEGSRKGARDVSSAHGSPWAVPETCSRICHDVYRLAIAKEHIVSADTSGTEASMRLKSTNSVSLHRGL